MMIPVAKAAAVAATTTTTIMIIITIMTTIQALFIRVITQQPII
jgi:hypothetical protein